jgi:hypothetical protein
MSEARGCSVPEHTLFEAAVPGAKRGEVATELYGELAGILALSGARKNNGGQRGGSSTIGGCGGSQPS